MADFCKCGSLKVKGKCTNRRCVLSAGTTAQSSLKQDEEIRRLCLIMGEDDKEYIKRTLTRTRAKKIITALNNRIANMQ